MKVAIDISPLKNEHQFRGIGSYTRNLVEALKKFDKKNKYLLVENSQPAADVDVIHYPFFDPFFLTLPLFKKKKTIVTIHDLTPLVFPEHYPPGVRGKIKFFIQKMSLKGVKVVVTDSQNSKKDIIKFLGFTKDKIQVVYLAALDIFRPLINKKTLEAVKKKYHLPQKFVLYVGDVNYNKNILGLVKATKIAGMAVVIVGKQATQENFDRRHPENQPLVQLLDQYGKDPKVLRLGFVPENDLIVLYNLANVYCQPSFYEGFGLPVLEAMACGCPVVCANVSSLPEICGQAAIMVDPYNPSNIAQRIKEAMENRKELVRKGFEQCRHFTWKKVAQEMVTIYQKVNNE